MAPPVNTFISGHIHSYEYQNTVIPEQEHTFKCTQLSHISKAWTLYYIIQVKSWVPDVYHHKGTKYQSCSFAGWWLGLCPWWRRLQGSQDCVFWNIELRCWCFRLSCCEWVSYYGVVGRVSRGAILKVHGDPSWQRCGCVANIWAVWMECAVANGALELINDVGSFEIRIVAWHVDHD